jgi:RNA polymerase sigma-70 factor (ECF subfamily)
MALGKRRREGRVGESAFWMATYEEHGSAVMAFLASRTGRRDVAEDLLQETFVRAIRARPDQSDPGSMRSYLFTTAHHLLISRHRKRRPLLFSEVSEQGSHTLEEMADPSAISPESATDLARLEERLREVLETLPPDHRTAFEQAVLRQCPYPEIAREQGWTLGRVKSNVHRARKKVIAALGDLLGPRPENRS